jgi:hypothetical protein
MLPASVRHASNTLRFLAAPGALLVLAACSSQAATTYPGEALATLSGTVKTSSSTSTTPSSGPMDAALVWANVQFSPDEQLIQNVEWVGESAPVSGAFPATFTLNVYQPPPDSALIACPSSSAHIAVAFIVAVPSATSLSGGSLTKAVGEAYDSMLLYLDTDEPAGWSCLANMGFAYAPTKGFHLMTEVHDSIQARALGACYPAYNEAPAGLATPITLTLASIDFTGGTPSCSADLCASFCETKAEGCGAPTTAATNDCEALCAQSPTPGQISCIDTSDCDALKNAFDQTGTVCGIGANGSTVSGSTNETPDSGPPDGALAD